jgi:hypothetical protein
MFDKEEEVALQSALSYELSGHPASVELLDRGFRAGKLCSRVVVVPSLNRLDVVVQDPAELVSAREFLGHRRAAGWEVWALVPLAQLARAHDTGRGSVEFVQGWWTRSSGQVAFTSPEIP